MQPSAYAVVQLLCFINRICLICLWKLLLFKILSLHHDFYHLEWFSVE